MFFPLRTTTAMLALTLSGSAGYVEPLPNSFVEARLSGERLVLTSRKFKYVPPTLTDNFAIAFGDSRTQNGGGYSFSTTSVQGSGTYGGGHSGWLFPLSGNKLIGSIGWNYGVAAQSTAGLAGRLNSIGSDCNSPFYPITSACYTGLTATTTSSGNNAGVSTFSTTATPTGPAGSPITAGSTSVILGLAASSVLYTTGGTIISAINSATNYSISIPLIAAANTALVTFAPAGTTSNYANYGGGGFTFTSTDSSKNTYSTPQYSPHGDPAKVVFILSGVNDSNLSQRQSLNNLAAIFDDLGPAGANKIVIVGDESPTGLVEGFSIPNNLANGAPEVCTVTGSPAVCTVTKHASYYDTQTVFFAPATSGLTLGLNDGLVLTADSAGNCASGPSAPSGATHYYCVNAGVYTLNAADVGTKIAIYYRWVGLGSETAPNLMTTIHNWLNSSTCSDYTDPLSGITYTGLNGALCNRPWVHVAQTWNATKDADPSNCTSGHTCYPGPWISSDGVHPSSYGGEVIAAAMITAAQSAGAIRANEPFPLPTVGGVYGTNGALTATTGTVSGVCSGLLNGTNRAYYIGLLAPTVASGAYSVGQRVYFNNITTGIPAGTAVTCLDAANNLLMLASPATLAVSTNAGVLITSDNNSLIANGVFDHVNQLNTTGLFNGCGAANVNCGQAPGTTKGIPAGWYASLDSNSQTAITAGTLGFSYGMATAPFAASGNNYDYEVIQIQGYAGGGANPSASISITTNAQVKSLEAQNDMHRGICDIKVAAGPNGHLTGFKAPTVQVSHTTSTFNPPGVPSTHSSYNTFNTWVGSQGGGLDFTDATIAPGAPNVTNGILSLPEVSIPAKIGGSTLTTTTFYVNLGWSASDPVSATVYIGRCALVKSLI